MVEGGKTWWQRFDDYHWRENQLEHVNDHIEFDVKTTGKKKCLIGLRMTLAVLFCIEIVIVWIVALKEFFIHLTFWGVGQMTLSNLLFLAGHWRNGDLCCQKKSLEGDQTSKYSPLWLFKWATIWFQSALIFNCVITVIYWGVLWPMVTIKDLEYMEEFQQYGPDFKPWGLFNHGFPVTILIIDWWFNSIIFDWRHFWVPLVLGILYFIINSIVSIKQGEPIYPT